MRLILAIILLWLIATACGPAWHLQRAQEKGAKIDHDTSMLRVRFHHKGPEGSLDLSPLFKRGGANTRWLLKDTLIYKDSIRWEVKNNVVKADCPDVEEVKAVPCVTTTTISAGFTKWQMIGAVIGSNLFFFLIFYAVYRILKLKRE